jgi:hypothetical protein
VDQWTSDRQLFLGSDEEERGGDLDSTQGIYTLRSHRVGINERWSLRPQLPPMARQHPTPSNEGFTELFYETV